MKDAAQQFKVTYYRSTHPCTMILCFQLIAFVIYRIADHYPISPDEKWMVYCAIGLFVLGSGYYAIKWMHSIRFTTEEIIFYRLGTVYRRILWTEIVQAGLVKEYKADKLTIVLTPSNCPKYDSQYITTTHYVEKHRWKLILLDATKDNKTAVRQFYGDLEYEAPHHKGNGQ